MEKIEQYRKCIKQVIRNHACRKPLSEDVEVQTIFDTEDDHYQLVHAGWRNQDRQYGCLAHVDIKAEKIWIQYDGTEAGIANELVELGISHDDIVLAYFPDFIRPYTDFAVT